MNHPVPRAAVVDASVVVKWVVPEADTANALLLRGARLFVPDLLASECANVLWKKVARKEIDADEAVLAARTLGMASLEVVATHGLLERATQLAISLRHPAYDAIYLLTALDLGVPLITADERLVRLVRGEPGQALPIVIQLSELQSEPQGARS